MKYTVKTKTIYVLLTAYADFLSLLVRLVTFGRYSHASIGIDEQCGVFFSFVIKNGFHTEHPLNSRRNKKRKCALYMLEITEEAYSSIKDKLNMFNTKTGEYHYNYLGILLCIIRIPHNNKSNYFCSQFVSELLISSGAIILKKKPCLYLPDDFRREPELKLCFQGTLGELANFY